MSSLALTAPLTTTTKDDLTENLNALKLKNFELSGNKNKKRKSQIKRKIKDIERKLENIKTGNYYPDSQNGCHVVRFTADWIVQVQRFRPEDFGCSSAE
eukprot:Pgem_evm1s3964